MTISNYNIDTNFLRSYSKKRGVLEQVMRELEVAKGSGFPVSDRQIQEVAKKLGLQESLVEREYHRLVTIEAFRAGGMMKLKDPICLGGGHGRELLR